MDESQEEVTAEQTKNTSTTENYECEVCSEHFENLQEVLKHHLVKHTENNDVKRCPVNPLKKRVNVVLKAINTVEEQKSREELSNLISDCAIGRELNVILKKYELNKDDFKCIFSRVLFCLEKDLERVGNFTVHPYGSIANGLALKTSDIDLHISCGTPQANPNIVFKIITKMLFRNQNFSDIHPIRKARVPIIKCIHKMTGFSIDINTSEPFGVHNSKFIHDLIECDIRIYQLMLFLKIWSKNMHIYGAFNLTNYCLINLVIFYLQNSDPPVLAAVKILQRNAKQRIINGINFAVNTRGIPADSSKNIHELIKGFFSFYNSFDFANLVIAPYLGKAINKVDFQNKSYKYPEYQKQLLMFAKDGQDEELQTDRPLCVQDMFCLNINVGKCLADTSLQYFKKCVALAHRQCSNAILSRKQLYHSLLVGIIEEIVTIFPPDNPDSSNSASALEFDIVPRRNELKSLARFVSDPLDLNKFWAKEYIDAFVQIITDVYRIDMTVLSPSQNTKCKKIDETEINSTPPPTTWSISCYVDLWSGRQMQRNNAIPFMEYQLAQTKQLHAERRQNSKFAVKFNGKLTISITNNYSTINIQASSSADKFCKKDPLRKFFGMLKCSMQNFNLKQRIYELELQTNKGHA